MATAYLTSDRLKSVVSYDPETGQFTRLRNGRKVGTKSGSGYLTVHVDGKNHNAHRLAWLYVYGEWPQHCIDHINGDRTDNRISNLRDVPQSENIRSKMKCKGESGEVGVHFHKGIGMWVARLSLAPLQPVTHLGCFLTKQEAVDACASAKQSYKS